MDWGLEGGGLPLKNREGILGQERVAIHSVICWVEEQRKRSKAGKKREVSGKKGGLETPGELRETLEGKVQVVSL